MCSSSPSNTHTHTHTTHTEAVWIPEETNVAAVMPPSVKAVLKTSSKVWDVSILLCALPSVPQMLWHKHTPLCFCQCLGKFGLETALCGNHRSQFHNPTECEHYCLWWDGQKRQLKVRASFLSAGTGPRGQTWQSLVHNEGAGVLIESEQPWLFPAHTDMHSTQLM